MKTCTDCGSIFTVTGRNHIRCFSCAKKRNKEFIAEWQRRNRIKAPGAGKGGTTKSENLNPGFKHGQCVFRRWAKERLKQLEYCCERCGNKIEIQTRGTWAGHHKDHNRKNNTKENLEVLCKRCHQIEHKCWRAFQSVTTISKESTPEMVEAPNLTNSE